MIEQRGMMEQRSNMIEQRGMMEKVEEGSQLLCRSKVGNSCTLHCDCIEICRVVGYILRCDCRGFCRDVGCMLKCDCRGFCRDFLLSWRQDMIRGHGICPGYCPEFKKSYPPLYNSQQDRHYTIHRYLYVAINYVQKL